MTGREFTDFLDDILAAITTIEELTQKLAFSDFAIRNEIFWSVVIAVVS